MGNVQSRDDDEKVFELLSQLAEVRPELDTLIQQATGKATPRIESEDIRKLYCLCKTSLKKPHNLRTDATTTRRTRWFKSFCNLKANLKSDQVDRVVRFTANWDLAPSSYATREPILKLWLKEPSKFWDTSSTVSSHLDVLARCYNNLEQQHNNFRCASQRKLNQMLIHKGVETIRTTVTNAEEALSNLIWENDGQRVELAKIQSRVKHYQAQGKKLDSLRCGAGVFLLQTYQYEKTRLTSLEQAATTKYAETVFSTQQLAFLKELQSKLFIAAFQDVEKSKSPQTRQEQVSEREEERTETDLADCTSQVDSNGDDTTPSPRSEPQPLTLSCVENASALANETTAPSEQNKRSFEQFLDGQKDNEAAAPADCCNESRTSIPPNQPPPSAFVSSSNEQQASFTSISDFDTFVLNDELSTNPTSDFDWFVLDGQLSNFDWFVLEQSDFRVA